MKAYQFSLSFWLLVAAAYKVVANEGNFRLRTTTNHFVVEEQSHRALDSNMMAPGPRVAGMDRTAAVCSATYTYDLSVPMEETIIEYYYAIESTDNITVKDLDDSMLVRSLEETLFHAIHPAILWCYYDDSTIGKRNLETMGDIHGRRMTLEEARRLSIVTFSTTPEDEETTSKHRSAK
jgi:hypothetical protein